ncbi:hypothetical protein QYE76_069790 [Lolium multiflorum]|uniref:Uncharacterized protein n=1 Tax=Lolium multiflorum TaxID=4521 RepID=A0AAD8SGX2_LOLMU|nr:hypothetical protein QYE76_069790 [Lolium multiflorum]
MALPALRARLGLGLGRSCATGIAKLARGGNGSVNYGKSMTTAAGPIGTNSVGFAKTVSSAAATTAAPPVPPARRYESLSESFMSLRVSTVVGFVCASVGATYFVRMKRKVDKMEKKIGKLEKKVKTVKRNTRNSWSY